MKKFKTWSFYDKAAWKTEGVLTYPLMLDVNCNLKPAYIQQVEIPKTMINPSDKGVVSEHQNKEF